jgi:hypothetical protein
MPGAVTLDLDPDVNRALILAARWTLEGRHVEAGMIRAMATDLPDLKSRTDAHIHMPSLGPYSDTNPCYCLTCGTDLAPNWLDSQV